ncbi:hypothetical protein WA026_002643 [Henosepilachna vigintioctopunctata]|uniref:Uncharacterized protein n=1 Tax=Henosepilachna vigintioctopunctata TaxID=420089 RepID=A0AAW1U2Y2_9CUCU
MVMSSVNMKRENPDMTEENINIIKNIIEDFPVTLEPIQSPKTKNIKGRKRCKNCNKYTKISNSADNVISKNKKYQISPKTPRSMDKNFTYFQNSTLCRTGNAQNSNQNEENEVYISFAEKDNKDNKDANTNDFRRLEKRRKSFFRSSVKYSDDIRDEVKIFMESKKNQDKVSRNVKEVGIHFDISKYLLFSFNAHE